MSEAHAGGRAHGEIRSESANTAAPGAADWLCLAAAPTFAIMALLTAVVGRGAPDMLCSAMQDGSALGGMVPMYLLMSAFHSAPWLKLIAGPKKLFGQSRHAGKAPCDGHRAPPARALQSRPRCGAE
jgi:hypothetical protein